jgi:peptidoglycan/xylan/chitin deacetylase (PgdA/CDA1 family)
MFAPLLLAVAAILIASLNPGPIWTDYPPEPPPLIVLIAGDTSVAGDTRAEGPDGNRLAEASHEIGTRAAAHLSAKGVRVSAAAPSRFEVGRGALPTGRTAATARGPITLSVGFGSSTTPHASGTETRFGGDGDDAWRMAASVQRHLVSGLKDVLGHDSYDRGAVELPKPRAVSTLSTQESPEEPWVATYPLFATNPGERSMLLSGWPRELIAAALANAVIDYLDPRIATPERSARGGWRAAPQWQPVAPRVVTRAASPLVALTFDGGASSAPTPAILAALREAGVRATMFMTADFVERNPGLVVQMARDGHEFGNHSATHPDMTGLSNAQILAELDRLERAVLELTGRSTRPWFRPPYGAQDQRVVNTVASQGYYTIMWTADSADWRPEIAPATVEGRLLSQAGPGAILIQHLGSPQSGQVTARVLAALKARGVAMGTLSEVLGSLD